MANKVLFVGLLVIWTSWAIAQSQAQKQTGEEQNFEIDDAENHYFLELEIKKKELLQPKMELCKAKEKPLQQEMQNAQNDLNNLIKQRKLLEDYAKSLENNIKTNLESKSKKFVWKDTALGSTYDSTATIENRMGLCHSKMGVLYCYLKQFQCPNKPSSKVSYEIVKHFDPITNLMKVAYIGVDTVIFPKYVRKYIFTDKNCSNIYPAETELD